MSGATAEPQRAEVPSGQRSAVLGIDTATAVTTVALLDGRAIVERSERADGGHAAGLPGLVAEVLAEAHLEPRAVGIVAVSIGPGSFTGLRVGLAFAKGIVFAGGQLLVGVPTLEAFAAVAPPDFHSVAACLDARKGEVYVGLYRRTGETLDVVLDESAAPPEEAARLIERHLDLRGTIVIGDAAERYENSFASLAERGAWLASFREVHPRGGAVARAGLRLLERHGPAPPETLLPRYLRRSEAEIRFGAGALTRSKTL